MVCLLSTELNAVSKGGQAVRIRAGLSPVRSWYFTVVKHALVTWAIHHTFFFFMLSLWLVANPQVFPSRPHLPCAVLVLVARWYLFLLNLMMLEFNPLFSWVKLCHPKFYLIHSNFLLTEDIILLFCIVVQVLD